MQHGLASHHSPVSMPGAWANWPGCSSVLLGLCLEELSNGTTELRCDLLLEMSRLGLSSAGKGLPWTEIGQGKSIKEYSGRPPNVSGAAC